MQSKSYVFDISNCYGSNEACGVKCKVFMVSLTSLTQSVSQTGNKSVKRRDEREIKKRTGAGQSADTRLKRAIREHNAGEIYMRNAETFRPVYQNA